jgi:hypothetical protein
MAGGLLPAAISPEFEMTSANIAAAFVGGAVLLSSFAAMQ